jgi:DNA-binding NarL/FixJ family response regulator
VFGDRHAKRRPRLPFLVRVHALTPGQSKITALVFAGLRRQTLAERPCISVNTLQVHFKAIFDKVDVSEPPRAGGCWFGRYHTRRTEWFGNSW